MDTSRTVSTNLTRKVSTETHPRSQASGYLGGALLPLAVIILSASCVTAASRMATPAGLHPANGDVVDRLRPVLEWAAVPNCTSYEVQVARATEDIRHETMITVNDPAFAVVDPLDNGGEYEWRVRAVDEHGFSGDWSPSTSFRVEWGSIDIEWPPDRQRSLREVPELRWTDLPETDLYELAIAVAPGEAVSIQVEKSAYRLSIPDIEGQYISWRVRGIHRLGLVGNWTEWREIAYTLPWRDEMFRFQDILGPGDSAVFVMGDRAAGRDAVPERSVELTRPYSLAVNEATTDQIVSVFNEAVVRGLATISETALIDSHDGVPLLDLDDPQTAVRSDGERLFVVSGRGGTVAVEITWFGAAYFAAYLTAFENAGPAGENRGADGKPRILYRLPTEAEWEYAARQTTTIAEDSTSPTAEEVELVSMLGGVWEWVQDWYDPLFYAIGQSTDPLGPESGTRRVLRGGADASRYMSRHVANRFRLRPDNSNNMTGFRIVRERNP